MHVSKEWNMVQELYEMIDELDTTKQKKFIKELQEFLDPYLPFLDQKSEKALNWLWKLHDQYCLGNYE